MKMKTKKRKMMTKNNHGGKRKNAGAKLTLTPEIKEVIIDAISHGMNYKDACSYAGISYNVLHKWISGAKKELQRNYIRKNKYEIVDFYLELKAAKTEGKLYCIKEIRDAGKKDWRAYAWLAARVYGYTEKTVVEGGDKPIKFENKTELIDGLLSRFPDKDTKQDE
jgi:hypothetical protein